MNVSSSDAARLRDESRGDRGRASFVILMVAAVVLLVVGIATGRAIRGRVFAHGSAGSGDPRTTPDSGDPRTTAGRETRAQHTSVWGPEPRGQRELARGEVLYQMNCARCHGVDGHGDGEGSLLPGGRPRDFASDDWRFPKTRRSIQRVIAEGVPGTTMPAAGSTFTDGDIAALADHVLQLADRPAAQPRSKPPQESLLERAGFVPSPPRPAPELELASRSGQAVSLESLRGRSVLIHFWGTRCIHCLAEFPELARLAGDLESRGLTVLSVCADEDELAEVENVARDYVGDHALYVDTQGLATHRYHVQALPMFVLVDPEGRIVGTATGAREWNAAELLALVEALAKLTKACSGDRPTSECPILDALEPRK